MCESKVQHMTGRKTGCNRSRPVSFGFSIFRQTSQLATEKIRSLCNRNRWSGLLQLGSVRFRSFFQSSELDLWTLCPTTHFTAAPCLLSTKVSKRQYYLHSSGQCDVLAHVYNLLTIYLEQKNIIVFRNGCTSSGRSMSLPHSILLQ